MATSANKRMTRSTSSSTTTTAIDSSSTRQSRSHSDTDSGSSSSSSAVAGLCAMFTCCFQPTHDASRHGAADDDSIYMSQQHMSARKLPLFRGDSFLSAISTNNSSSAPQSAEHAVVLAGYHEPPRWVRDDVVDACSLCSDAFDVFNRKHHCRSCGLVYCKTCAASSDRVVKLGFFEPVRLCTPCATQATIENAFYETHLPLLEAGDVLFKHGLLRKRAVSVRFIRAKSLLQYQRIDMELRQFHGDIKAIALDMITAVRDAALDRDCPDCGFVIVVNGGEHEHKFDAPTPAKRKLWVAALRSASSVRNALVAAEREKRAKLLATEHDAIAAMAASLESREARKASFHEDRLRKRAEQRESLRAKYSLGATSSTSAS